ncbi:MAG: hypothetical protein LUF02_01375 [Erysipelotrichaceae bacterium]|nr:hypothetical protein [Erysipelotrichaceae bacterium]
MKKLILILSILLLSACSTTSNEAGYDSYYEIKNNLINQVELSDDYPFSICVVFNELDDYYRYDVVIDDAQVNIYDITAMAYCNEDDTTCPVIGLFDEEPYHLIPNVVDKENNYYKGIQLSGTCEKIENIKVYISYYLDEGETEFQEYYIEVQNS